MDLQNLFSWGQQQVTYILFIGLFIALIVTAFKRAWIAMIGVIIGLSVIAIFIINPRMIIDLGQWFSNIVNLGG